MLENILSQIWNITPSWVNMRGSQDSSFEYSEEDVDNFVEIAFRQVAEDLGVKFKDIKDILYGRNIEFFEEKARLFADGDTFTKSDSEFKTIMSKLKIPNIHSMVNFSPATKLLKIFKDLDAKDKIEVLDALSEMKVQIPSSTMEKESSNFLNLFNGLTQTQKYEVVKQFFKVDVNNYSE